MVVTIATTRPWTVSTATPAHPTPSTTHTAPTTIPPETTTSKIQRKITTDGEALLLMPLWLPFQWPSFLPLCLLVSSPSLL